MKKSPLGIYMLAVAIMAVHPGISFAKDAEEKSALEEYMPTEEGLVRAAPTAAAATVTTGALISRIRRGSFNGGIDRDIQVINEGAQRINVHENGGPNHVYRLPPGVDVSVEELQRQIRDGEAGLRQVPTDEEFARQRVAIEAMDDGEEKSARLTALEEAERSKAQLRARLDAAKDIMADAEKRATLTSAELRQQMEMIGESRQGLQAKLSRAYPRDGHVMVSITHDTRSPLLGPLWRKASESRAAFLKELLDTERLGRFALNADEVRHLVTSTFRVSQETGNIIGPDGKPLPNANIYDLLDDLKKANADIESIRVKYALDIPEKKGTRLAGTIALLGLVTTAAAGGYEYGLDDEDKAVLRANLLRWKSDLFGTDAGEQLPANAVAAE